MIKNIFYEIRKNKINYKLKIPITYSYNNIISSIITFRKFNGIYNFGLYYYNNKQKKNIGGINWSNFSYKSYIKRKIIQCKK